MHINELENIHKDKRCIILASGPSLHHLDIQNIKTDDIVIAINAGIVKYSKSQYFLSDDNDVQNWNYWDTILPQCEAKLLLYKDKPWQKISSIRYERIIWYKHKCWYDLFKNIYYDDGLELTKEAHLPIIGARNSSGSAIHFAYIMGCNPIILVGCDCCFKDDKKYFWQFEQEPIVKRLKNKDTIPINPIKKINYNGKQIDTCFLEFVEYWNALSKQCDKYKIKIYDASDGALSCFEKMDIKNI